jgi:hypothetical protein
VQAKVTPASLEATVGKLLLPEATVGKPFRRSYGEAGMAALTAVEPVRLWKSLSAGL